MKKEFVPYEIALELKELGFDENCLASYFIPNIKELKYTPTFQSNSILKMGVDSCTAPLYQQAFKWFREKHKLHSAIEIAVMHDWYYAIYELDTKRNLKIPIDEICYKTYEEAELECLKKLIEIVKK